MRWAGHQALIGIGALPIFFIVCPFIKDIKRTFNASNSVRNAVLALTRKGIDIVFAIAHLDIIRFSNPELLAGRAYNVSTFNY